MRNLKGIKYEQWKPPGQKPVTAAAWDLASDSTICTVGPTEDDALIELFRINASSDSQ